MKHITLIIILLLFYTIAGNATNVIVANLQQTVVDEDNHRIEFEISWEDSWRHDNLEPNNYDGVWIFVKYRNCQEKAAGNPGNYNHVWLSPTLSDHTIGSGTGPSGVDMVTELGFSNIDGTDRVVGIFIYQPSGDRVGDVASTTVSLLWKTSLHSPAEDATVNDYDIQVFAIEMVNIPDGSFYIGDGVSTYSLRTSPTPAVPIHVTSNAMGWQRVDHQSLSTTGTQNIPDEYPNGYDSFWIMKYETSQIQYLKFLNTLSRTIQNMRIGSAVSQSTSTVTNTYVMSNSSSIDSRNAIVCEPIIQVGGEPVTFKMDYDGDRVYNEINDGSNIACNWMSGEDLLAYLDWAALRPLTEFEYEKAARGPHVKPFGYTYQMAWGIAETTEVTGIDNPGEADEAPSNSGTGICVYNNNANVAGPMRCGFAATPTTENRYSCGASYYGVFELTGNVSEPYMSIRYGASPYTDSFQGRSGDGIIDETNGMANEDGWPQGSSGSSLNGYYMQYRGGDWALGPSVQSYHLTRYLTISARYQRNASSNRYNWSGGRGGRYVTK